MGTYPVDKFWLPVGQSLQQTQNSNDLMDPKVGWLSDRAHNRDNLVWILSWRFPFVCEPLTYIPSPYQVSGVEK